MTVAPVTDPRELVGAEFGPFSVLVEAGPLRLFAQVVGLKAAVHTDANAAAASGHPGLLVPPTYLFGLERGHPELRTLTRRVGFDLGSILHGEQRFTYSALAFSGDELTFRPRIADYYERKGGALRFLVRDTSVDRAGEPVAELRNVLVVRAAR